MTKYTLTVHISQNWIQQFNDRGWKLCFATAVETGGRANYNVVAFAAKKVADTVTIEWEEKYQIAASKDQFADRAIVTPETDPQPIEFGQSFSVDDSWTTQPASPDERAPRGDGFLFKNHTRAAACVAYKVVQGRSTPVYISPDGPLPRGQEFLVPRPKCKVWFSLWHGTESMVASKSFAGEDKEVDLTGNPNAEVWYTESGRWSNSEHEVVAPQQPQAAADPWSDAAFEEDEASRAEDKAFQDEMEKIINGGWDEGEDFKP
ncbi:hypothetical protein B0H66DRAFT_624249 [Apodospora peruviana]|uniref:Uncharacterized protein n=1 Tax=Apodospora peruviana TaxID=516989 RepID=A0AAE0I6I9_9PEZI|nr:hypothetical protein B0H66DRAFT_624249 [Apodospora peruviana]